MHKSRVGSIVIDCQDLREGLRFWSAALGGEVHEEPGENDDYAGLRDPVGQLRLLIQKVPEPKTAKSRLHLDIETDDIEAELTRLEALGARRQQKVETWWIMEDPCGNEFCVIQPESPGWPERAWTWE